MSSYKECKYLVYKDSASYISIHILSERKYVCYLQALRVL